MSGQRIFITGGASGLGRALAERYARQGARLCIGDVNDARGAETQAALAALGATAQYLRCDVTREEDLQAAADWMQANWGGADLVFNNAGVADLGGIEDVPMKDWQWIVDINLLGVVRGCKVFAPMFKRQGSGHFVNVASMAGLIHPPFAAGYNATKAAVVALSETLNVELNPAGIAVSVVCPAFFRTNLSESIRTTNPRFERRMHRLVDEAKLGAEEIAARIVQGVQRGDFHILTHAHERRLWLLKRFLPYRLYVAAFRRLANSTKVAQQQAADGKA